VTTPAPGCTLTPTNGIESRQVNGRTYHLLVPPGLEGSADGGVPLVLALHGANVSWTTIQGYADFDELAGPLGYVVAYPEAVNKLWGASETSGDVDWLRAVVDDIETTTCIDPSHVHAVGHSLGGYMAQRLACNAPDLFASVAAYAAGSPTLFSSWGGCSPSRPSSVSLYHGNADALVNVSLGRASRDQWIGRFSCTTPASARLDLADGFQEVYGGCEDDVYVAWREFAGQSHLWPTLSDIEQSMWSHFLATPHPTRYVYESP
jgi:polyhydroxybutyrate depolymerase